MKLFKILAVALPLAFLSQTSDAQISVGAQVNYLNFFGDLEYSPIGFGARFDYAKDDRTVITGAVNFYLPKKETYTTIATANDNFTNPQTVSIDAEQKVKTTHITVGAKRYFAGDVEDDGGFYGLVEAGIMLVPVTVTYEDAPSGYSGPEDAEEKFGNFTLNFGIGGEIDLDFGYLFGEAKLTLPANQQGDTIVEITIPASVNIAAGVRIPFD